MLSSSTRRNLFMAATAVLLLASFAVGEDVKGEHVECQGPCNCHGGYKSWKRENGVIKSCTCGDGKEYPPRSAFKNCCKSLCDGKTVVSSWCESDIDANYKSPTTLMHPFSCRCVGNGDLSVNFCAMAGYIKYGTIGGAVVLLLCIGACVWACFFRKKAAAIKKTYTQLSSTATQDPMAYVAPKV